MMKKLFSVLAVLLFCFAGLLPASALAAPSVEYSVHVQGKGWLRYVYDGETGGTTGEGRRAEAVRIALYDVPGNISYRAYVQSIGWQDWVRNNDTAGTTGENRHMEAIQIKLSGSVARKYDVYYRTHCQKYGWLDWAKNGEIAGTSGSNIRMEALQIRLVKKGESFHRGRGIAYRRLD